MTGKTKVPILDRDTLRRAIRQKYDLVANDPEHGFHFHTGRPLPAMLGCAKENRS